jgi:hypothetical protein
MSPPCSEHAELFLNVTLNSLLLDSENVESNGLGDWSALSDGHDVTNSKSGEDWRGVSVEGMMSLFESVVLLDVMQIVSSNNNRSLHFSGYDNTPIK